MSKAPASLATVVAGLFAAAGATQAQTPPSYDLTLCQQAVKSQIELEHAKAKIEFGDKNYDISGVGTTQARVSGKGHFTKKDGTKKQFTYECTVDSAAGRVVNASFQKKD